MDIDFKTLTELHEYTKSALLIDTLEYIGGITDPVYFEALVDQPEGLYLPNVTKAIYTPDTILYPMTEYISNTGKITKPRPIQDADEFLATKEDIVTVDGGIYISAADLERIRSRLTREPSFNLNMLKLIRLIIQGFIEDNLSYEVDSGYKTKIYALIRPEYRSLIDSGDYEIAFRDLLHLVEKHMAGKSWKFFRVKELGTSIVVEEGIDYRIYEWYRQRFEQEDMEEGLYE